MEIIKYKKNMKIHKLPMRVRYCETDAMKVVHNSNYQIYFEEARTDLVRFEGIPYDEMERQGMGMPVTECYIKFKKPLIYNDDFTVEVTVGFVKIFSVKFIYSIVKTDGSLVAEGFTVHASIDIVKGSFVKLTDPVSDILSQYLTRTSHQNS